MRKILIASLWLVLCTLISAQTVKVPARKPVENKNQTCSRCTNDPALYWKKAIPLAAARAKVNPEQSAMEKLIMRESGGNRHNTNKVSNVYGLGQFKPGTWQSVGIKKTSCTTCQIEGIYRYVHKRYGSVAAANRKWESRGRTSRSGRHTHGWY